MQPANEPTEEGSSSSAAPRACPKCTFQNEPGASRCTVCEAPLLKRPATQSTLQLQQPPPAKQPNPKRGNLVVCGWPRNDGSTCVHEAAQGDVTYHRQAAGYHSDERARQSSGAAAKQSMNNFFGGASFSSSSKAPPPPSHSTQPMGGVAEELPPGQQPGGVGVNIDQVVATMAQGVSMLKLGFENLTEQLRSQSQRQMSVSRPVREEMVAEAVVARLERREKEQHKSTEEREAEAAKTQLDRKLEACTTIQDICNCLGCFTYSPAEGVIICSACTPFVSGVEFETRIPANMVGHFNLAKFGTVNASVGDGSSQAIKARLPKLRQSAKDHLTTRGHIWCVSNTADLATAAKTKRTIGLNVASTVYECLLEARSSQAFERQLYYDAQKGVARTPSSQTMAPAADRG